MNTTKLRSKRVLLPTVTAAAVLGVGGTVWTATASDDLRGSQRERVANAATEAVGGTVVDVETGDDGREAYEVEVRLGDGTEVDVALDEDLKVVSRDADEPDGTSDADDRALSASERASAERAALDAVGGGTVVSVEAGDDRGEAYEVEVRDAGGTDWDLELGADFSVLHRAVDG